MSTPISCRAAGAIAPNAAVARSFVEQVVKDVPDAIFARKPEGMNMNHPAWVLGHLSLYTDDVLKLIGREDLVAPIAGAAELFGHGSECRDDINGDIYPDKETLLARFVQRTNTMAAAVAETDDETLARPNTLFLNKELPTVGGIVNFLMGLHVMMHAGQVSSWRRAMGLGPCM